MRARRLLLGFVLAGAVGACATRTVPPAPSAPAFPDLPYPALPQGVGEGDDAARVERGWRFLQSADLRNADLEFAAAVKRSPALYPARTGTALVAMARMDFAQALRAFDEVLQQAPAYVPALLGRGQSLLALNREGPALESFEAALAADASLTEVRRRVDVLRFRALQDLIARARAAAGGGQLDEAAAAYDRAVTASPDSAFLHREAGLVARRQGRIDAALQRFNRAVQLDPGDAASLTQIGELLESRQDLPGAEAAYRRAAGIEPSDTLTMRLAAIAERLRDLKLPPQFQAIPGAERITRGELAALVAVRLEDTLATAATRDVVMTDVGGHWAATWIATVARTGVIEPFANHTFQPGSAVTRADLAGAVSRVVTLLARSRPDLQQHLSARPAIADMPPAHLSYPAASVAVAVGVMPLAPDGRFEVARPVSGAEASTVIARLRDLARAGR